MKEQELELMEKTVRISAELIEILDDIKKNVEEFTWGVEDKLAYAKASQILARKIKKSNII